ncbi:cell filamentation protein Fic [Agrobacterium sp. 13-626]|uniref:Fic family protein n=1 Tax=Rhizobium rhizogenes TaxID=359 RepID=UPI0008100FF3|nr:Fic family protein [Rhizobium rhizogenes]OCI94575.1 cell filamentation protein Fic [Agrobacterium sp. 13-626]NTF69994.1 Fic family protein [Rhizobium rhizogenes]NTH43278.1 Fic family protein [Rhizobium rhizogenes]NTH56142.1 Fic family protein [Rhizobium rhizogenes]NTH91159.1 Fic family protein [Rhizobium rhizogenes]
MGEWPTQSVRDFHGRPLPERGEPAGYAAIMARYDLILPPPIRMAAIAERHHPTSTEAWLMLTPRYRPEAALGPHLVFAFRYEGVDLQVLSALFQVIEPDEIEAIIRATPTGSFARRLWFLYEWLTDRQLNLPDPGKVRMVPILDPNQQYALDEGDPSPRHKVSNNLPGTPAFCPLVRRTPDLVAFSQKALGERAREAIGRVRPDLVVRAAAFILLNDSKSSFAIEGERPSGQRAARWGQAIAQAGVRPLSLDELDRLQRIVIGDARFVRLGLRDEGGFIGVHDRDTNMPIPDHISARHEDLESLVGGLIAFADRATRGAMDPVVAAACLAFGFVYIHPYVDGNGRLHRWLIHHALAAASYSPPGLVFPVSAAILRNIDRYRAVLESWSAPLLPFIEWRPTVSGNVEVLNETATFYRYFDATAHTTFLYDCVEQTVERDLPQEVRFLQGFDIFSEGVQQIVDMPTAQVELLHKFLDQNDGRLSQRARTKEFTALDDVEVERIEALHADAFARDRA